LTRAASFFGGGLAVPCATFRVTKRAIQETLKKEVMEAALKISGKLGFREKG